MKGDKMPTNTKPPYSQRFLIIFLSVLFALLFYWLLGFILQDIGSAPGPDLDKVQARYVDKNLVNQDKSLQQQQDVLAQKIQEQKDRQALIQTSIKNSQNTIQQFLEIQRLNTQKSVGNANVDLAAYNESLQLFLADQKRFQALNETIASLNEQSNQLKAKQQTIQQQLNTQREAANKEYDQESSSHALRMGVLKLLILVPLLLVAGYLFVRHRNSLYAPLIYAASAALLVKLFMIIHDYFPSQYFKYILILVLIFVVLRALVQALRRTVAPKIDFLLKQYRQAYARFLCPVCEYPIQRGPLKYNFWNRNNVQRFAMPTTLPTTEEKYTCPACGTGLFQECSVCHTIRHELLPFCKTCGDIKELHN